MADRSTLSPEQKLKARLEETENGCHIWTGAKDSWGYGSVYLGGKPKQIGAHRLAWIVANGPIPDGMFVCHSCDTPACCNPDHLWLGTVKDNNADRARKGRTNHFNSLKTHCAQGHPYDEANTRRTVLANGHVRRLCRTCMRTRYGRRPDNG